MTSGQAVTFSVTASGPGPLTYQWQRDGVDIPNANGPTYTLAQARPADAGAVFTVRVTGSGGSVTSASAALSINAAGALAMQTGSFTDSRLSASSIDAAGGTLTVTDPADPLVGARLVFPAALVKQAASVSLSSAPVTAATGLPAGAAVRSRAIRLQVTTIGSGAALSDLSNLVTITLPTDASSDHVAFYKVEADGLLEPAGLENQDTALNTITFRTRAPSLAAAAIAKPQHSLATPQSVRTEAVGNNASYALYVAVGLTQTTLAQLMSSATSIDTGFRPSADGWYIPNYGSYYRNSRGGNCMGMVGFAKYYYQQGFGSPLASTYRDAAPTPPWVDDEVAIELASRIHNGMSDIWNQYVSEEINLQNSAGGVARSMIGALYITERPVLIYLGQVVGNQSSGAHAISAYKVDLAADGSAVFHVYDPNFPRDDGRSLTWKPVTGFGNYFSGATAATSNFTYNYFRHFGFYVGMTAQQLATAKQDADQGFPNSVFPKVKITSIKGKALFDDVLANVAQTQEGQTEYKTSDAAVVIEGTVLGGNAQTAGQLVRNLHVVTPSGNFDATIDNQAGAGTGKFSVVVPLKSGINQIALLATDPNSVSHWAAFRELFIESNAAPSYFTVTLGWDQGTSDVDLYVREPNGVANTPSAGKTGDIVFYGHRKGISTTNAYLDYDNTVGLGPEHYVINPGLVTRYADGSNAATAYGSFKLGVHYYAWHGDSNAADKSLGWTVNWRLLSACNNACANPETDGLWVTGTQTGRLSIANSSAAGPSGFNAVGPSWSNKWDILFAAPLTNWTVPPSNTIMLP